MLNLSVDTDVSEPPSRAAKGLTFYEESGGNRMSADLHGSGHRQATATGGGNVDPADDDSASLYSSGAVPQALENLTPSFLKTARHPIFCLFHLLFKVLALLTFVFGSFVFGGWEGDFVFTFVTTTILLSFDFWIVKNVTGRILVGMRWWNDISEDGSSSWVFESNTEEKFLNTTDKTVFWTAMYLWSLTWAVFFILYIIRLKIEWVLLVVIGLVLSCSNLVGYWKCSKDSKRRVKEWASNQAVRTILGRFS